eukprot:GDKJ01014426.1.p1 GENE.GDKJ01014426.1~~GDKJ01014426.1.p1  ORF type:complete len:301 (-),score=73.41 GDKJ01014426.1:40-942(-)
MTDERALVLSSQTALVTKKTEKDPVFVKYEVDPTAPGANSRISKRVVKVVEEQIDPLEPSRFRHKKAPRSPGSPPPAVLHSPQQKLTAEDQKNWKIPPCVSLWKNQKGYTIPLDKRIAGDGRYNQSHEVSDKFATFSESLFAAAELAREEVKLRSDIRLHQKAFEAKQQEDEMLAKAKEMKLKREAAQNAAASIDVGETSADAASRAQRAKIMQERAREIEREFRKESTSKRYREGKLKDRDVTELIALGGPQASIVQKNSIHEAQLFNKEQGGVGSGFGGDDEENIFESSLWENMKRKK